MTMTIAKRLILMLAVPLLIILGIGLVIRQEITRIEERIRFVAESRVIALARIGDISRTFAELRVSIRSFLIDPDPAVRATALANDLAARTELKRLLDDYAEKWVSTPKGGLYLNEFRTLSTEWLAKTDQIKALAAAGGTDEANNLLDGPVFELGQQLNRLSKEWTLLDETLAMDAGKAAIQGIENSRRHQWYSLGGALLISGILGWLTFRGIITPVRALQSSVETIARGDYAQEVPFTQATDETGALARAVAVLKEGAAAMAEQRWIKSNAASLTGELQATASLAEFGQRFLSNLVPVLGGGVAGFHVLENGHARLRRVASYGVADDPDRVPSIRPGEGLVGQCALERKPVTLTDLPADYCRIASGVGQAAPVQAVAWPLMSQDSLLGVLEFASFRALNATENALLDELLPVVAMSLEILQRNLNTRDLLDQIQTSEQRTRLILESSAEGIFGMDTEGTIGFVNPAACRMLGFTAEELIDQPSHASFTITTLTAAITR